ncbi:DnaD domain protein [Pediococcus ethanolidurans]|uniref:DnaD domain protein n=1 Tax=Pediococcus ethanolidurans TaxID=319653 RepID=UPI0021E9022C|nr:DnaD domain protein [Pediococcus ethanolidurans]MCV3321750.1 DnaD domain protein [Pediococcus ethanolidurans]MCV3324543.1 DnaD domain protein [Pediococcus ethanolidurans]MCV3555394.1 DnaD domain protein [Pediococcus ethanolidurans]
MAIVRKSTTKNYSIIPNIGLIDPNLSAKAKGLLAYMLTLPNDWRFHQEELEKHFTDGTKSIRTALNELITQGYVVKKSLRDENGKFSGTDWIVYDNPTFENRKSVKIPLNQGSQNKNAVKSAITPSCEKRNAGKRNAENGTLLSTNYTNNLSKQRTNKQKDEEEDNNSNSKISSEIQTKREAVFKFWENNGFGSISPFLYEKIGDEIKDFKEAGLSEETAYELIKHALEVAVDHNARIWIYVRSILNGYRQKSLKSVEQVKANEKQFKAKYANRKPISRSSIPDRGEYDNDEPLPF